MLNGVSAQRPSHSVFIGGEQLPLEARMGGIFLGFLCAVALVLVFGRLRASQPPHGALGLACWALVALTGLDGLNAFLFDGNLPHLYTPNTALRLLTGLAAGLGVGLIAAIFAYGQYESKPKPPPVSAAPPQQPDVPPPPPSATSSAVDPPVAPPVVTPTKPPPPVVAGPRPRPPPPRPAPGPAPPNKNCDPGYTIDAAGQGTVSRT